MFRRIVPVLLLVIPFVIGCAGPSKLAQRSEDKLEDGDVWKAWNLATRALDKAPANTRARQAAASAAGVIAEDWRRRIRALAASDSLVAAEQVMEFASFRTRAIPYTTVPVDPAWAQEEQSLRQCAARTCYQRATADVSSARPKRAYFGFVDAERYVPGYRDAARLAERALEKATTRVAFVPLKARSGGPMLGREVASTWRGEVVERMAGGSRFTRILPAEEVERAVSVADLERISREDAVKFARRAGADRVVWGTIGETDSKTSFHVFTDAIARRIVEKGADGRSIVRWVEVPFQVIARVRNVQVDLEYEVIATRDGATLARRRDPCTMSARVVWTASTLEGAADTYSLVSETVRSADPERAKAVETRWKAVVGEGTTIAHVIDARRASQNKPPDRREVIARFMAGAAFVMLEELPSTADLAFAALGAGWKPVYKDLLRLDAVDDADLGVTAAGNDGR